MPVEEKSSKHQWYRLYFNRSILLERPSYLQSSVQNAVWGAPQGLGEGGGVQGGKVSVKEKIILVNPF